MQAFIQQLKTFVQNGQFDRVIEQVDEALATTLSNAQSRQELGITPSENNSTDRAELLYFKALALRYTKRYEDAIQTLQQLHHVTLNHARSFQELGYCFLALHQSEQALTAFARATVLNPALVAAWQQQLKLLPATELQRRQHIESQITHLSKLPKPLLGTLDLIHEGKIGLAEKTCRTFLQQHKHHPDGMCLLAEIGVRTKVFDDALFLLETCVTLYPDFYPAQAQLIELYCQLGLFHKAKPMAEQFLQQQPTHILVKSAFASACIGLGKVSEAADTYQQILARAPHRAGIHVQLGHALKYTGEYEGAITAYRRAYQLKPTYGDAYWSLANTKTYQFSDNEIVAMEALVEDSALSVDDRIHACFALGKALEDEKQFRHSWVYYRRGNELKSAQLSYDATLTSHLMSLQQQHCTPELFSGASSALSETQTSVSSSARTHGNQPTPIFIVGLPRAGSTLLEQILASHSQVEATNELHIILSFALKLRGRMTNKNPAYPANLATLSDQQLKALGEQYISESAAYRTDKPYFIDKMPNNFVHIGLIKKILPHAIIIDARREPMACCFSGYKQLFGEGQEFSYNLDTLAQYYQDYVNLMAHWERVLPGQILRVQHEDVLTDLAGQVERLLQFCGLPFEQACVDFHQNKRNVVTPSSEQVRQPINLTSKDQWRNYAEFLLPLLSRFSEK